jgi:hypothetical protein
MHGRHDSVLMVDLGSNLGRWKLPRPGCAAEHYLDEKTSELVSYTDLMVSSTDSAGGEVTRSILEVDS